VGFLKDDGPNDERLRALGAIVDASATLEGELGTLYCVLVGSKYAAVIGGGLRAGPLIDDCRALLKANREIDQAARDDLLATLDGVRTAMQKRNSAVHGRWAFGAAGKTYQVRTARRSHREATEPVEIEDLSAIEDMLHNACAELVTTCRGVFGRDVSLDAQLRWEDMLADRAATADDD
jgi:hypothetical protein